MFFLAEDRDLGTRSRPTKSLGDPSRDAVLLEGGGELGPGWGHLT